MRNEEQETFSALGVSPDLVAVLESAGISGSLGASAIILGYSLTYWVGMLRKIQRTA